MINTSRQTPHPKVSIVVAVYNGEHYIEECIESLLSQTYQDFEIIVVNDGSTDATAEKLKKFGPEKIFLIHFETNLGVAIARNEGVKKASGDYVAILDADDLALPERLQAQTDYLDAHPDIALVGSYYELQSELGSSKLVKRSLEHEKICRSIFYACPVANTTIMVKRSAFLDVGGYPPEYNHGEDYRFLVRFLKGYKAANIPQTLVIKRETRNGLTFKTSVWQHFSMGLSHRLFAASELKASPIQYFLAIGSALGILMVRLLCLNRETMKIWISHQ